MSEPIIYHVVKGNLVEIKSAIFADGDTYVILNPPKIWIWIGSKSTVDEKFAAAQLTQSELIKDYQKSKVITIEQGSEPAEFLDIFGDSIKFVKGDVHSLLKPPKKD